MNIYLLGFMGTGKTTVGKLLSRKLGWDFVDLDDLIEKREKMKIVDIFSQKGEAYFRKKEKEVLREISGKDNLVVGCGGGVVLDEENIQIIKETGLPVRLEASKEVIYERTKKFKHRPLLNVENPLEKIEELLKRRRPYYAKIPDFIDTSSLQAEEVVERIIKLLKDVRK